MPVHGPEVICLSGLQDRVMVIYTVSYPPRLIPVSLVLPSLDDGEFVPVPAPGPGPQVAPASASRSSIVKVSLLITRLVQRADFTQLSELPNAWPRAFIPEL